MTSMESWFGRRRGAYGPDLFVDYINDFAERNRDVPFFVYYPWRSRTAPSYQLRTAPNGSRNPGAMNRTRPTLPNGRLHGQAGQKDCRQPDRLGLRRRTLVLFYSDNGTHRMISSQLGTGRSRVARERRPMPEPECR